MIPYNVLFFLFALGSLENRRNVRVTFWMACVVLLLFIGLRFEVGADWFGYIAIFDSTRYMPLGTAITAGGDPGFYAVNWLVHQMGYGIWAVDLICAAVFTYGLVKFANRQPNPWLAIAVAIPVLCVGVAMTATRQSTAIGFLLVALVAFSDGRLIRFLILAAIGALFHASALLLVPIVALSYTRNRLQSALVIVVGLVMAYYLLSNQIDVYMQRYTGEDPQAEGAIFRLTLNLLPGAIFLLASKRFGLAEHDRVLWRNISILAILCVPMLGVVASSTALDRIGLYMIPLQIVVFSRLPYALARTPKQRVLLVSGVIAYSLVILLGFLLLSTHGQYWMPYQFYPFA